MNCSKKFCSSKISITLQTFHYFWYTSAINFVKNIYIFKNILRQIQKIVGFFQIKLDFF